MRKLSHASAQWFVVRLVVVEFRCLENTKLLYLRLQLRDQLD